LLVVTTVIKDLKEEDEVTQRVINRQDNHS
jgi:hypothetical protein